MDCLAAAMVGGELSAMLQTLFVTMAVYGMGALTSRYGTGRGDRWGTRREEEEADETK